MKTLTKVLLVALGVTVLSPAIHRYALWTHHTDFPILYSVGRLYDTGDSRIANVYAVTLPLRPAQEQTWDGHFIYSRAVLPVFGILSRLEYFVAKSIILCASIFSFVTSIVLLISGRRASGRSSLVLLAGCLTWPPFFVDLALAQINSVLLLGTLCGVLLLARGAGTLGSSLIALASLFKLFPLGVSLLIGVIRPPVAATSIAVFASLLLMSGSAAWIPAITNITPAARSLLFTTLSMPEQSHLAFLILSAAIIAVSIGVTLWKRPTPLEVAAIAIPATFLASPVAEYYHLVFLVVPFVSVCHTAFHSSSRVLLVMVVASALCVWVDFVGIFILREWTQERLSVLSLLLAWLAAIGATLVPLTVRPSSILARRSVVGQ